MMFTRACGPPLARMISYKTRGLLATEQMETNETMAANEGKNPYFALLVAIGQDLKAICRDGQEFDVGLVEKCHHLLQATGQAHGHLGSFLVKEQVV